MVERKPPLVRGAAGDKNRRYLPEEFGRWSSVCRQFRRWTSGAVGDILNALSHVGIAPDKLPMVDIEQVRHHRFGWDLWGWSAPFIMQWAHKGDC